MRLQVRDLSTRGQYATPEAASPARVGQAPPPPGLQLTASAVEPFERQARRREPRKKVTFCLRPSGSSQSGSSQRYANRRELFLDPSDCEKLTLRHTARSRSDIVRSGPSDPLRRVQGQFLTENPIPASDWSPGTLRTHKIGRARRGPIWGHVGGGLFSGRYRTYQPVLLTTSPARATARVRRPDFRFFCFCGSYGDFRSLRTIREAGLWAMRRLKCPGHSDCAQIATWWPPDDAMASVPREVPRDRGTRVHTPSHCPGASFGRTLGGAAKNS